MDADLVAKLLRVACSNGPDGERLAALERLKVITGDTDWSEALKGQGMSREDMQKIYDAGYQCGTAEAEEARSAPDWNDMREPEGGRELWTYAGIGDGRYHMLKTTEIDDLWFAAVYMPLFCSTDNAIGALAWWAAPLDRDVDHDGWQWWRVSRHFATEDAAREYAEDLIKRSRADIAAKRAHQRFKATTTQRPLHKPKRRGLLAWVLG